VRRFLVLTVCLAGAAAFAPAPARALSEPDVNPVTTASEDTPSLLSPKPHAAHNPLLKRSRNYRGVQAGSWMLYPSLFGGAIYDNNLVWSTHKPVRAAGVRINPRIVAERDAGIHKTTAHAEVDARLYPWLTYGQATGASVGLTHVWQAQRDLTIRANVLYERKAMHISGGAVATPGGGYAMLASPLVSDNFSAGAAIRKSFGRLFLGLSLDTTKTLFSDLRTSTGVFSQAYRDSLVTRLTARGGWWLTPALYGFTEAAGNIRDIADGSLTSRGYRASVGLGTDRISLFRGEIFGGVQRQNYQRAILTEAATPVFGGKIFWYPTRAFTVRASLDQTFTDSSMPTPANPGGFPARVTTALLHVHYHMARDWSVVWRGGFDHSVYLGVIRRDNGWHTGATFTYDIYRNMTASLDYEFQRVNSNAANASLKRNAVTLGVRYRY
jgi:hypothetical protein